MIGKVDLYDGVNAQLTDDRFGRKSSAISLVNGYYKVPSGVYFYGTEFTIMVWVKVRNHMVWSRVIDFANIRDNAIFFALSGPNLGYPEFQIYSSGAPKFDVQSTIQLQLNTWKHLAFVFLQPNGYIYIDGVSCSSTIVPFITGPDNVIRTSNFVGRSNWFPNDPDLNADLDELKIFNRALTQQEVANEMNNNMFL